MNSFNHLIPLLNDAPFLSSLASKQIDFVLADGRTVYNISVTNLLEHIKLHEIVGSVCMCVCVC